MTSQNSCGQMVCFADPKETRVLQCPLLTTVLLSTSMCVVGAAVVVVVCIMFCFTLWQSEATLKSIALNMLLQAFIVHTKLIGRRQRKAKRVLSHQGCTHRIDLVSCKPLLGKSKSPAQKILETVRVII